MKCPKCAYVGFETSDRCRHCGYEFSLLNPPGPAPARFPHASETPRSMLLREPAAVSSIDADLALADAAPLVDLPLAGTPDGITEPPERLAEPPMPLATPGPLPPSLFAEVQPPPARTPLAVRRTAERPRSRATPHVARRPRPALFDSATEAAATGEPERVHESASTTAPAPARLVSALIDIALLAVIDLVVVYLTTQMAGVPVADAASLPLIPLCAFVFGLNAAYVTVFTANGGQTLGKMAMGLRVEATEGALTFGSALVRMAVGVAGGLVMGAGFLPALVGAEGRAVHDRVAHTRVVKVSA